MGLYRVKKGCGPHSDPVYQRDNDGEFVTYSRDEETGKLTKDPEGTERKKIGTELREPGEKFESEVDLADWDSNKFEFVGGDRSADKKIPKGPAKGTKGFSDKKAKKAAKKPIEPVVPEDDEPEEGEEEEGSDEDEKDIPVTESTLNQMKVAELKQYAEQKGIDIEGSTTKADIVSAILLSQE